jgi:hypothetical protein
LKKTGNGFKQSEIRQKIDEKETLKTKKMEKPRRILMLNYEFPPLGVSYDKLKTLNKNK